MLKKAFTRLRRIAAAGLVTLIAATALTGCDDSEDFVFGPGPVFNNGPTAVPDAYEAAGNTTLNVVMATQGVRANDIHNGALVTAFDAVSAQGGAVAMQPDGTFAYTPPVNIPRGTVDTFTYTIQNANGTSTATVSVTVNVFAWFVDSTAPNGGNGSLAAPFNMIQPALDAALLGDAVFIARAGGAAYAGDFVIPDGVFVFGGGAGLDFNNGILPRVAELVNAQQIISPGDPTILTGNWTMGNDTGIAGFQFGPGNITANAVDGVEIFENLFLDPDGNSINVTDVTGFLNIFDNDFEGENDTADYINATFGGTTMLDFNVNGNTFTNDVMGGSVDEALDVDGSDTANVDITFNNNTVTNTMGNAFEDAVDLDGIGDNATINLSADNNQITGLDNDGFEISLNTNANVTLMATNNTFNTLGNSAFTFSASGDATGQVTANDNAVDTTGDEAMEIDASGNAQVNSSFDNNNIANAGNTGIDIEHFSTMSFTTLITNNVITDPAFDAVCVDGNQTNAAIRNNAFSGMNGDLFLFLNAGDGCADVEGNTMVDSTVVNNGMGTFNVEQADAGDGGPLTNVNTITGTNTQTGLTSVADGFCPF